MNTHLGLILHAPRYSSTAENFNISEYGISYKRFVSNDNFDVDKLQREVIPTRSYKPAATDKIFFLPDCTVPRFKLRKMIKDRGVALVKTEDRSNIKFIGPETIERLFSKQSFYVRDKAQVMTALEYAKINYNKDIEPIYEMLELSTHTRVYIENNAFWGLFYVSSTFNNDYSSTTHRFFAEEQGYDNLMRWMTDPQIYDQKEILSYLNAGLMTKGEYESISRLFQSSDNSNHKIAMEMMANCDYEESCLYLLLLIRDFGTKMDVLPNKNHVNFKSLLKFFDVGHLSHFTDQNVLDSLIQNKLLNQTNLDYFVADMIEEFRSNTNLIENFGDITYTEEIRKALEENVLDRNKTVEVISTPPEELQLQL